MRAAVRGYFLDEVLRCEWRSLALKRIRLGRGAHDGSSVAETAIFDATEKLLAEYSLRDLSVAQIIAEAGLSRATFYFYFGSKFSVAASLLGRITDETFELVQPYVSGDADRAAR